MYQNIAKSPEAFEKGLNGAEDNPSDVDAMLGPSGETVPQQRRLVSVTGSAKPFQTFSDRHPYEGERVCIAPYAQPQV